MGKHKFIKKDCERIVEMYVSDLMSVSEISNNYSCNIKTIYKILDEYNVERPKESPYNYIHWVKRGMSIESAKNHIKTLRPTNIEYWIHRGHTIESAKDELEKLRLLTKKGHILRFGEELGNLKWDEHQIKNSNKAKKTFKSCREYWINLGYNDNIIDDKISESQSKFSLKSCVIKYGDDIGYDVWKNRQDKWQKTLNQKENISEINKKKDSRSIDYFKKTYGNEWIEHLLMKRGYFEENIEYVKSCIYNSNTYDDLLEFISKNYEYIDYYNFNHRICRKILCDIFDVKRSKMKSDLLKKYEYFGNSQFGHKKQYGGIVFSGVGEYYIGKYLIDNQIKFTYNKKYPFGAYRYDFYLIEYDIYIEYTGMMVHGNVNKYTNKYMKKLNEKIKLSDECSLNVFVSCDYLEIIEKIKTLLYEEKN